MNLDEAAAQARAEAAQARAEAEADSAPSLGDLLSDITRDVSTLMRQEVALARAELQQSAKNAGVTIDVVNPMIMDYRDGTAGPLMGDRSLMALEKGQAQLKTLLPGKTDSEYWSMMAATAMLGQNDAEPEIFTLDDAQKLLDFARAKGMARLSFWSLDRDNPTTADTLGWILFKSGVDRARGLVLLQQAARGAPSDAAIRSRLERARRG